MEDLLAVGQLFAAFHCIQKVCHFVHIQTHNSFFVDFRGIDQRGRVRRYNFFLIQIFKQHPHCGKLTGFPFFLVVHFLAIGGVFIIGANIIGKIFHEAVNILRGDLAQMRCGQILRLDAAEGAMLLIKIAEENPQIVGIRQTGFSRGGLCDAAKEGLHKGGQLPLDFPKTQGFLIFQFLTVIRHQAHLPYSS